MSNRSWYYAAQGQQRGPVSENELRDLIARGVVTAQTLLWTEGMAGWEKADRIPGLMSGLMSGLGGRPPAGPFPEPRANNTGSAAGAELTAKLDLWPFLGWALLFGIGVVLVIPAPWTATYFYRHLIERISVPGRGPLAFTGQPLDIWYVFIGMGVLTYIGHSNKPILPLIVLLAQAFLSWMALRWVLSKLEANGQPVGISFEGSSLAYLGWYVLTTISVITIIGWAWAATAWMRWICKNIQGTRREIVFNATGFDMLWRTLLFAFGCAFIIPIPWLLRWYTQWYVSQFALVPRPA
jgi:uncharacterized protein DUF4339